MCACVYVRQSVFECVHAYVRASVFSGGLKFAYGRAMEERVSSWLVID